MRISRLALELLDDALFLVKHTRDLLDLTTNDTTTSKDMMEGRLPRIGEIAFTASVICVSCSPDKRFASLVTRYLGAATLQESIVKLSDRIKTLQVQNIAHDLMLKYSNSKTTHKVLSGYDTLEGEDSLLGRKKLLDEVESIFKVDDKLQQDEQEEKLVVAVCLHGMGGVGKSTLALTIFNKLLQQQKHKYVPCRVQMELESEMKDVPGFQRQILQDIRSQKKKKDIEIDVEDTLDGREILLREFKESRGAPILLYIDNVEDPELLMELLPNISNVLSVRLLITSRNSKASAYLHRLGVKEDRCRSIAVETLDEHHSRKLLRKEALIKVKDKNILDNNRTLTDLENQVLRLCDGLPLALKLMGGFIAYSTSGGAQRIDTWKHVVSAMEEGRSVEGVMKDKLYASLRVSIDALEESVRSHLFDTVVWKLFEKLDMVELRFVFGAEEMQNLIDRHLLEAVESKWWRYGRRHRSRVVRVKCHDVIASLVKRMVCEDHGRGSSMWNNNNLAAVSTSSYFSAAVDEAKMFNIGFLGEVEVTDVQLRQMTRLRYALDIRVIRVGENSAAMDLPRDLRCLSIFEKLPQRLKLGRCPNLRLLDVNDGPDVDLEGLMAPHLQAVRLSVEGSLALPEGFSRWISRFLGLRSLSLGNISGWGRFPEAISTLSALEELELMDCESLRCIPEDIRELTNLTWLLLGGCKSLQAVPEGICMLTALKEVELRDCESLRCIPEGICQLTNLCRLDLGGCKSLEALPEGISMLISLEELQLRDCESLRCIPEGIHQLTNLCLLEFAGGKSLQALPKGISMLTALQEVDLRDCELLRCIPEGIRELATLTWLDLSGCNSLEALPEWISMLTSLRELHLTYCKSLEVLPEGISMLTSLQELELTQCGSLRSIPDGIRQLTNLSLLRLEGCQSLEALPEGISMLISLQELQLAGCESLRCIPECINLSSLRLSDCQSLEALPEGISMLTSLKELALKRCQSLRCIPEGICQLINLSSLHLEDCKSLEALPEGISMLIALDLLHLRHCESLPCIPEGIRGLSSLFSLRLEGCKSLQALPEGISMLTALDTLVLRGCESLRCIPEGIRQLTSLSILNLDGCKSLEALPGGISMLTALEVLNLSDCESLRCIPEGIRQLTNLTLLRLEGCKSLHSLPEGISTLTSLQFLNLTE